MEVKFLKDKCPKCGIVLVKKVFGAIVISICYSCGFETRTRLEHE